MPDFKIRMSVNAAPMMANCPRGQIKTIARKIDGLKESPSSQGKPLKGQFTGIRSIRSGRFRILFVVDEIVDIVAVGIRREGDDKDVYSVASKLQENGDLLA